MNAGVESGAKAASVFYEKSLDCVHCGLCLPHCPTYRETGDESAGPRGRIYLMRGFAEGQLEFTEGFAAKMDLCLVCRNCETVCPSGVEFGHMMEWTRDAMRRAGLGSWIGGIFRRFMLNVVVTDRRVLGAAATLMRLYRRSGLMWLARATRLVRLMPRTLRAMEAALPDVPPADRRRPMPERRDADRGTAARGRVALLSGCVMEQLFGDVNRATSDLLAGHGFDVLVPPGQRCCGALHAHAGDLDAARDLARQNIAAFEAAAPEWLVTNSAGCGAALKDYASWFADDPAMAARARAFSARVIDVLPFFAERGLESKPRAVATKVRATYDAPCHLRHAQRCGPAALDVLGRVSHLELVPLPGADDCCGAAGIYNLTHPEMSQRILAKKLDQLEASGARVLITGNPGCMLQWRRGIMERGLQVQVVHPVEVL